MISVVIDNRYRKLENCMLVRLPNSQGIRVENTSTKNHIYY